MYDTNGVLVASWNELTTTYGMNAEADYITSTYQTDTSSPYYVLTNNAELADGVKLVTGDITKIGLRAFYNCTSITSISIPEGVTSIGYDAFYGCTSLTGNTYDNAIYLGNDENPYVVLWKTSSTSITSCEINEETKIIYSKAITGSMALLRQR